MPPARHMLALAAAACSRQDMLAAGGCTSWKETNSHGVVPRLTLARSALSHLYCALRWHKELTSVGKAAAHAVKLQLYRLVVQLHHSAACWPVGFSGAERASGKTKGRERLDRCDLMVHRSGAGLTYRWAVGRTGWSWTCYCTTASSWTGE